MRCSGWHTVCPSRRFCVSHKLWQWHWPQGSWALLSLRHLLIHRRNSSLWGWEALEQAAQSIIPGSVWGQVGLLLSEEQLWPSPAWMWPHGSKSSPWCAVNFVPFLPFLAPALCGQQLWGGHTAGSIPWAGLGKAEDGVCCRIDWSAAVLEFFLLINMHKNWSKEYPCYPKIIWLHINSVTRRKVICGGGEQGGFSSFTLPSFIPLLIKKITFLCHHFNDSQGTSQHRHKSGNQLSERMRDFSSLNHKSMLSSL